MIGIAEYLNAALGELGAGNYEQAKLLIEEARELSLRPAPPPAEEVELLTFDPRQEAPRPEMDAPGTGRGFERLPTLPSSSIDYMEYDRDRQLLRVAWASGQGYEYDRIDAALVDRLLAAPSLGSAVNAFVRPFGGARLW